MTALKCNRCGKLYEAYYPTEEITKSPFRFYRIEKQMIPDNYSHYLDLCLDLCPDCQRKRQRCTERRK